MLCFFTSLAVSLFQLCAHFYKFCLTIKSNRTSSLHLLKDLERETVSDSYSNCKFEKLMFRATIRRIIARNATTGQFLSKRQALVVQMVDNAIHRINHYPVDSEACFVHTYPLDSVIQPSNNGRIAPRDRPRQVAYHNPGMHHGFW